MPTTPRRAHTRRVKGKTVKVKRTNVRTASSGARNISLGVKAASRGRKLAATGLLAAGTLQILFAGAGGGATWLFTGLGMAAGGLGVLATSNPRAKLKHATRTRSAAADHKRTTRPVHQFPAKTTPPRRTPRPAPQPLQRYDATDPLPTDIPHEPTANQRAWSLAHDGALVPRDGLEAWEYVNGPVKPKPAKTTPLYGTGFAHDPDRPRRRTDEVI